MKYKIIRDKNKLNSFIETLPDLYSGETYFIRLITRSKYVKSISVDTDIRFLTTNKENIIQSIKQLECEIGSYYGLNENEIGVYLSPNPRSQSKVIKNMFLLSNNVIGNYRGQDPIAMLSHVYRTTNSRHIYYDIDFDGCDVEDTLIKVKTFINKDCVRILHTKGGIHLIIKYGDIDVKKHPNWFNNIISLPHYDSLCMLDNNIPIPGCSQFGFIPYFTDL